MNSEYPLLRDHSQYTSTVTTGGAYISDMLPRQHQPASALKPGGDLFSGYILHIVPLGSSVDVNLKTVLLPYKFK